MQAPRKFATERVELDRPGSTVTCWVGQVGMQKHSEGVMGRSQQQMSSDHKKSPCMGCRHQKTTIFPSETTAFLSSIDLGTISENFVMKGGIFCHLVKI